MTVWAAFACFEELYTVICFAVFLCFELLNTQTFLLIVYGTFDSVGIAVLRYFPCAFETAFSAAPIPSSTTPLAVDAALTTPTPRSASSHLSVTPSCLKSV